MWRELYDTSDAHKHVYPFGWNDKLNDFQRLLVLRCFRPDKMILGVQDFVIATMGEKFVIPPTFDLAGCYTDASNDIPLVFVLSAGSDPMSNIIKFAAGPQGSRFESISLGQGQGPKVGCFFSSSSPGSPGCPPLRPFCGCYRLPGHPFICSWNHSSIMLCFCRSFFYPLYI